MGASFVQALASAGGDNVSTRTVALTGVGAGNLIVAIALWEGATTTVAVSDGTTSFEVGTPGVNPDTINGTWDERSCPAYLLSANGGDKTYTLTLDGNRQAVRLLILEFATTAGSWVLDGQATYGYGNSGTLTSGALSTTGRNVAAIGWGRVNTTASYSGETIGGSAAVEVIDSGTNSGYAAYRLSTLSSGTAVASGTSAPWLAGLIAFAADYPDIHCYINATDGNQDGTELSEGGALTEPLPGGSFTEDENATGSAIQVWLRTTEGTRGPADYPIALKGTTKDRWRLAATEGGLPGASWGAD